MATTCKQAIANFEGNPKRNKEQQKAEDCTVVRLYFQTPPISKLDSAALNTLRACEHLALSSNNIDKMTNLAGMRNLKILSLSRNALKRLDYLDPIADRLEQLWISYNPGISSFAGIEQCSKLRCLFAGNCNINTIREISRLQVLPNLEELVIHGNPLQVKMDKDEGPLSLVEKILTMLPNLRRLDGVAAIQWRTRLTEGNEEVLRELFDKIDADGSGLLTLAEMRSAMEDREIRKKCCISNEMADDIFSQMDSDGSKEIDWPEFKNWLSTKRKMTKDDIGGI
eukprot:TRINITY_DN3541_c0_g1_i1.p1 TRINITY_DN3541_c0_g1~~TRINITY_DN3541_c0_g1_i1.p1  ORF type:complete len:283 (-),score=89.52 TRINITY_DN3541_c0_g1_i1:317-1165(-)